MLMRLSESLLKRFLLGGVAEEKRREIEDLALRDEETFDLIEAIETELVDGYVRGELAPAERLAFERRLAPLPRIRQRIAHARVLAAAADEHVASSVSEPRTSSVRHLWRPRLAFAATVLVVAMGTLVAYQAGVGPWRDRSVTPAGEPSVVYTLVPGALRDATAGQLVEREDQEWIGLRLALDDPAVRLTTSADLEVALESVARGEVIRRRAVTPEELAAGSLTWALPPEDLVPGDYTILLLERTAESRILANYEITVR